jgi:hypothetical protein
MGRSISKPNNSASVVYLEANLQEFDYEFLLEDIKAEVAEVFPSFENCEKWIGNENRAVLENRHAFITVSEYCGVVAIALVPKNEEQEGNASLQALTSNWIKKVSWKFEDSLTRAFGESVIKPVGVFSNGETVYKREEEDEEDPFRNFGKVPNTEKAFMRFVARGMRK